MKRLLILLIILSTGCGNGYFFETTATYQAVDSNLEVNLTGRGFVIDGDDLSNDGIVTGVITSPKFSDTIFFKANEWKILSLEHKKNKMSDPLNFATSVANCLEKIGYSSYKKQELVELGEIIQSSAYGPKGGRVDGQTDLIKVLIVDVETNRGNQKKKSNISTPKMYTQQVAKVATIDSVSIAEIKYQIEEELPTIFDYYKQEKIEDYSAWSDKMFGRCCSNTDLTFNENLYFKISANFNNEKYPFINISDTDYTTAFVFKSNAEVKINLQLDLSAGKSFLSGKYSNKNLLKSDEVIMNPIQLSLINGYAKSKVLFYKNSRVKEMKVYVNNKYKETITLLDMPLVQEFKVNAVFKTNDIITLEPITYYKGTEYDDICISEIQTNLGQIALPILNEKYNLMELMNKK